MRKILSLVLCMLLILSLSASAFADTKLPTITVVENAGENGTGAVFSAYKLMDVTYNSDKTLFTYTINKAYENILYAVTGKTKEVEVLDYLLQIKDSDGEDAGMRKFADDVYAAIKAANITADYISNSDEKDFDDVAEGYYLIVETPRGGIPDTVSLAMLKTVYNGGDNTFNAKEDYPTVEKSVKEVNDSESADGSWGNTANYDIGDKIEFKLEGSVSDRYKYYKDYYYSFHDTLDGTMTFTSPSDIVIKIDEVPVTNYFHISFGTVGTKGTETFKYTFTAKANLKDIEKNIEDFEIDSESKIVVTYSAVLTENAVIGEPGNKNKVYLVYQNDPYADSLGYNPTDPTKPNDPREPKEPINPGKTPENVVVVYTFKTIVNKVTAAGKPLTGAGFTLYKWEKVNNSWDWKAIGQEIKVTELGTDNKADFNFMGLDAGIYKLHESTVPSGYNAVEDLLFAIVSEGNTLSVRNVTWKDTENDWNIGTEHNDIFTVNVSSGSITVDIENNFGQQLPETGGTGTTVLYVVGAVLVLAAVVLLVTKKRMASAE